MGAQFTLMYYADVAEWTDHSVFVSVFLFGSLGGCFPSSGLMCFSMSANVCMWLHLQHLCDCSARIQSCSRNVSSNFV